MTAYSSEFDDIPGTRVFTAQRAKQGYHLNQFCMSLMKPENRERFKAGERAYLDEWPMTEAQKQAVLDRDYNAMLDLGGFATDRAMIAACPYAWPWNVLGWPGVNVPAGFVDGLPVGAQLLGPANSEPLLISLAAQLEADLRWHELWPPQQGETVPAPVV